VEKRIARTAQAVTVNPVNRRPFDRPTPRAAWTSHRRPNERVEHNTQPLSFQEKLMEMHSLDATRELCRRVVTVVAPDELASFDSVWTDFVEDPDAPLCVGSKLADRAGAAGIQQHLAMLTPILLPIIIEVARHLASRVGQQIADDIYKGLKRALRTRTVGSDADLERIAKDAATVVVKYDT
jgi:hypothetical protein